RAQTGRVQSVESDRARDERRALAERHQGGCVQHGRRRSTQGHSGIGQRRPGGLAEFPLAAESWGAGLVPESEAAGVAAVTKPVKIVGVVALTALAIAVATCFSAASLLFFRAFVIPSTSMEET